MADTADQKLITEWETKFKACQQQRVNFERQWHLNLAFYYGRHWLTFHNNAGGQGYSLSEIGPSKPWRKRLTTNKTKRVIRNEITKLSKEEPQFYVVPSTSEESDRSAALAGEAVGDYLIHSRSFNVVRRRATFWTTVCGTGFMKAYYDPHAIDSDGKPGKMTYEAVTPFHLFVPHLAVEEIEEQPFVIHARTIEPDVLKALYGKDIAPETEAANTILDSRYLTSIGVNQPKDKPLKQCFVKEVWLKPCKNFPEGAMFILADKKLVHMYEAIPTQPEMVELEDETAEMPMLDLPGMPKLSSTYPYQHKEFPFAKIEHVPAGRFYAQSVLDDMIPVMKEYNRTRSLMLETRDMAGKPQWAMTKGSFEVKSWTTEPGIILQINPGFKEPIPLVPPPMPPHIPQELEIAVRDMDDISGQFEISKGRTPPGVEAASAIAYLQEENDTILYHTVSSLEEAVQKIGRQSLALVHQYWDEERIIRVISKNNTFEAHRFKSSDLQANLDFRIEAGSMAPRSTAAKQAFLTELMKLGAIPPEKALRYLQMNETSRLYEELRVDERHAERENAYMANGSELVRPVGTDEMGQPIPEQVPVLDDMGQPVFTIDPMTGENAPQMKNVTINPYDNHETHIYEHEKFQKSQEYELLPLEIKQLIQAHVDEHKEEMVKESRTQQQEQVMVEQNNPDKQQGQPV